MNWDARDQWTRSPGGEAEAGGRMEGWQVAITRANLWLVQAPGQQTEQCVWDAS